MNRPIVLLALGLGIGLGASCGGDAKAPVGDTVVGVKVLCELDEFRTPVTERGDFWCVHNVTPDPEFADGSIGWNQLTKNIGTPYDAQRSYVFGRRQQLTIRTSAGTTYVVTAPFWPEVHLGDPWPPPKR